MIYRTNSKIPPLEENNRPNNFSLSIKSKPRPFLLSHSKPLDHDEIEQQSESQSESQLQEVKVFPVQIYKDMLKGEKIYLETYYKDQLYESGYEPYIIAMGGEVTKRACPSTTVVLTGLMSREKYNKLKAKVQKICKPSTCILSIVWLEEIYRQKRKVEKENYLFDEKTDIIDDPNESDDDDSMPDYFEREIFQIDLNQDLQNFLKTCDQQFIFKVEDNKKFRDKLGQDFLDIIEPKKYQLFSQFDEDQFKILKNRKGYKYFWPQNKEKQKKKNRTANSVGQRKPPAEKQKKPRPSIIRKPEKQKAQIRKTQKRPRSDSFDDSSFQIERKNVGEKPASRRTIDKAEIENYQKQNKFIPAKISSFKKREKLQDGENKSQHFEKQSKKIANEAQKPEQIKFEDIGKLRPAKVEKKKNKQKDLNLSNASSKESDADYLKRNRQKNQQNHTIQAYFSKMMSKQRVVSQQNNTKSRPQAGNSNSVSVSMSQPSQSTPPKSQSDITEITEMAQKTITAPKNSKYR